MPTRAVKIFYDKSKLFQIKFNESCFYGFFKNISEPNLYTHI